MSQYPHYMHWYPLQPNVELKVNRNTGKSCSFAIENKCSKTDETLSSQHRRLTSGETTICQHFHILFWLAKPFQRLEFSPFSSLFDKTNKPPMMPKAKKGGFKGHITF